MARQDRNPPPWDDSMRDGCSWVPDWLPFVGSMVRCCKSHDKAFFFGGSREDFEKANNDFKECIQRTGKRRCMICGKVAFFVGKWRKWGVERFGEENFNWLGPGMPKG